MKNKYLILIIIGISLISNYSCGKEKVLSKEEIQRENEILKHISQEYSNAIKLVEKKNSTGLLKLLDIAQDCDTYSVEYCEVATEMLNFYLFLYTKFWIHTFANIKDQKKIKLHIDKQGLSIGASIDYPEGITSFEQYCDAIIKKLKIIKGKNKKWSWWIICLKVINKL